MIMMKAVPLFRTVAQRTYIPSVMSSVVTRRSVRPSHLSQFSTMKRKDEENSSLPDLQTVDDLIAENEALKKEVQELKVKLSKVKPGLMGTIKEYGMPFFLWWSGVYLSTGVGFYLAFDTGLLNGPQAVSFVMDLGLDRLIDPERLNPSHGNVALAFILNEAVEPIRFPFCVATIPMVKRLVGKKEAPAS